MKKNAKKTPEYKNKKFFCETCSFGSNKKSDFIRHISTTKHLKLTHASNGLTKKTPDKHICEFCNRGFNHRQSLFRHKKQCNNIKNKDSVLSKIIQNYPNVIHGKFECKCGKSYKYASGLSKHKTKCKYLENESEKKL